MDLNFVNYFFDVEIDQVVLFDFGVLWELLDMIVDVYCVVLSVGLFGD